MLVSCVSTRASWDALRVGTGVARVTAFCLGVTLTALSAFSLRAADLPAQSPSPVPAKQQIADDWTGFYLGAHVGYGTGHSSWSATQPGGGPNLSGSLDFFQPLDAFTQAGSYFGGLQAGYNYMLPSHALIGVEADVSFPSTLYGTRNFSSGILGGANYNDTVEMFGSARGRLGYDLNHLLYYVTGGLAWTYDQAIRTQLTGNPIGTAPDGTVENKFFERIGWTAGAGIETPIAPGWTAKLEYLYSQYASTGPTFPLAAQRFDSNLDIHQVRWGVNYKLGGDGSNATGFATAPAPPDGDNWILHTQSTFAGQF